MCTAEEFDQDENASALHSNSSARGVRLTPAIQMSDSTFPLPFSIFSKSIRFFLCLGPSGVISRNNTLHPDTHVKSFIWSQHFFSGKQDSFPGTEGEGWRERERRKRSASLAMDRHRRAFGLPCRLWMSPASQPARERINDTFLWTKRDRPTTHTTDSRHASPRLDITGININVVRPLVWIFVSLFASVPYV